MALVTQDDEPPHLTIQGSLWPLFPLTFPKLLKPGIRTHGLDFQLGVL